MRTYHRVHVQLSKKDRKLLAGMLNKGWESARVLRRALLLRQLDQEQTAGQVASQVGVASKTVRAIARRYEEEGLESALYEKPRPGQQRRLNGAQSQRIIAMVCGAPPQGQARWSVRLMAQEAVKRKLVPKVGLETIRIPLRNHDVKPWRGKKWGAWRNGMRITSGAWRMSWPYRKSRSRSGNRRCALRRSRSF